MKVLIQNPETLLYLEALGRWCHEIKSAFDFGNSDEAIAFCTEHHIAPVQVVLQWDGLPYSISIPVMGQQSAGAAKAVRARKQGI